MKKYLILLTISFSIATFALCQSVGIGTTVPNTSAQLDITSSAKGLLIPRMNTAAIVSISNPAKGLMVFDSSKNQLMVNMGTAIAPDWETIVSKSGWNLTGNSGINSSTNFIGTTDAAPFIIKVNNVKSGFVDSSSNDRGNAGFGFRTLASTTTGTRNLAMGYKAMVNNTTGDGNTATGMLSLYHNSTGSLNTACGYLSLYTNTDGVSNTSVGAGSLIYNIGSENTAVGLESLSANTTGSGNTGVGINTLFNNTQGYSNVAIGTNALYNNTDRSNLVAIGDSSMFNNGIAARSAFLDANFNTAVGSKALFSNTTGYHNTAFGTQALYFNNGSYNTGIGTNTLSATSASQFNTAVGYGAGEFNDLGYNNTLIGAYCHISGNGFYNCVALGEAVTCTANSQARIGNSSTTSIGGYADWTNFSDGRYKKNIQENVKGIDFIMKLRPVTYQLDVQGISTKLNESRGREIDPQSKQSMSEKEKIIFSGFVAQEVEKAAKESGYDFSGVDAPKNENDFYGLRYGDFVVPLVKTVQEQQVVIQQQQSVNDNQQQTINDLKKRLQSLEEQVKLLIQSSTHKN